MIDTESERTVEDQYANWHPETPDVRTVEGTELSDLERVIPDADKTLKSESEALLDYAKKPEKKESVDSKTINSARKLYEQFAPIFQRGIEQISQLFGASKDDEAQALGKKLIDEARDKSVDLLSDKLDDLYAEYEKNKQVAETELDKSKKARAYKLAMEAVDFIPVIGSAKMLGEGLAGRTMSGEKLSKGKRILHATEGVVFLALDLTGVGVLAVEEMKAGRVVTRSAALMRKVGMAREAYGPVYKTGRFLIENPAAAKLADKSFERIIRARKDHSINMVEKGKELLFDSVRPEEQELSHSV